MNNGNYIKINRSILDWEWYSDANTRDVFIHCLLKANWKDGRFEGVDVPRGSFVTSIPTLANELNISYQSTRTSLNHLKSTGELTVKTYSKFSVITINNYCQYQDANRVANSQLTGNQQATNSQLTVSQQSTNNNRRNKEGKKESREEGKNKTYYPNDEKLDQAFRDYVAMRKTIKAPMTDRAVTIAMNKLASLAGPDNDLAIRIIEEAIEHNWKSFYPLKEEKKQDIMTEWRNAL